MSLARAFIPPTAAGRALSIREHDDLLAGEAEGDLRIQRERGLVGFVGIVDEDDALIDTNGVADDVAQKLSMFDYAVQGNTRSGIGCRGRPYRDTLRSKHDAAGFADRAIRDL